jgi:peptidoglycan/LPS O-acetylase OafA/YrhL
MDDGSSPEASVRAGPKPRLGGIEALRGVAASAVVAYHVARHLNKAGGGTAGLTAATQFGHAGVDLFFVLSGFIILFVHRGDVGRPDRLRPYLARRFTRVVPIYWVALGATILLAAAGSHGLPEPRRVVASMTLAPTFDEPILGPAWTLQCEAVFYAVFAALIASRRAGLALLGGWACLLLASLAAGEEALPPPVAGPYALEFLLGMAAAWRLRAGLPALTCATAGAALFVAAALAEDAGALDGYAPLARAAYGVPAALLIAGLAALERDGRLRPPAGLRALGSASYCIYLFQFVFIGVAWQLLIAGGGDQASAGLGAFAVLTAAAIGGGMATHRWIERPLLRLVRRRPAATSPVAVPALTRLRGEP